LSYALVVGGSGGIGAACCEALAADGADIAVGYCANRDAAEAVASAVGGRVQQLDLTSADPLELEPGLSTLVYAAGPHVAMRFVSQLEPALMRQNIEVDVHGFLALVQAALPQLREAGGSIVAVTTAGLARHVPRDILSTAPKAALEALMRAIAAEEGRYGVRANTVAIGAIDAGMFHRLRGKELPESWVEATIRMTPLGRLGSAREVGDAVAFLASSRAGYITGQRLVVDGGFSA
jgi:3-oxoacyl-[acyl-carrier protein] reductase